ncbi:glycosyltransferase family 2 protein [Aridibaculum aurantiacum]|uniref:glycosyltransferase family 2 protein n=1 Tax=Aridibaculum aurantiacum TaxID=2810307 RepID=UPI001A97B1C2|nr:glycosyltransferase family 2 protein [Aridibaculum aurantiacum]
MSFAYVLFWISLFLLFYTYIGYGLFLLLINKLKTRKKEQKDNAELPPVTLIIPAYNEAEWMHQKIRNCLELQYPRHLLQLIFITDGSTDETNKIVAGYEDIDLLYQSVRKGKMAAINRSMQYVSNPIVVFSDANTLLNRECLLHIVKHYTHEAVGGVAGEKKIYTENLKSRIGYSEGLYWKYESMLKQLDSDFNTVVGAAGELFSMRTSLFTPQPENIILDDFMLSMKLCVDGYKVVYEPKAFAIEAPSVTIGEEKKRRVRIAAGAFQTIPLLWKHFLLINKPVLYFQYFSRRILRWVACPVCLLLLYVSNGIIFSNADSASFFTVFFALQNLFYLVAIIGSFSYRTGVTLNAFYIPFYFLFMNSLLVEGFWKYVAGKQTVLWEKSKRKVIPLHAGQQ